MKIVVCIKQVPDTTEIKINPVTGTLIREGVPSIMNPDDKGGLELALQFKSRYGADVTVISMGPQQAGAILRESLAMGADRAILLTDRKFAGADTLATSNALAGALRNIGYDIVITGRQAIDGDTAQVGPQIAEHLDLPQVSYVAGVDFDGNSTLTVKKEFENGYQLLQVDTPCLLTVLASAFNPRPTSIAGIKKAFTKQIEIWSADKIDVNEVKLGMKGSPTKVHKSFTKGTKQAGEMYEVEAKEAVGIIISKLKEKFII